jgi:hypothetical protein
MEKRMTKSSPTKLAAQKAYNALPANVKKREANNLARQHLIKEGKVHVGDGKDVAHITALQDGGTSKDANLMVTSQKANRGWRKGQSGYNVGKQTTK